MSYVPIIKNKGFDPAPVAGKIPIYADSQLNPDCVDTPDYIEFWDEQIDRCVNGYTTAGQWIPPRYYYMLNFCTVGTVGEGVIYPRYYDLQYEYFMQLEEIKKEGKAGIIVPKARRKLLTEMFVAIISHGVSFQNKYRAGVAAGLDRYVTGVRNKLKKNIVNKPPAFQLHMLKRPDEQIMFGVDEMVESGEFVDTTFGGDIWFATFGDDPTKFEGEYFNDVLLEEANLFPKLSEAFNSIKPALQLGEKMIGTFYIQGTGNRKIGNNEFKTMYLNADSYDLVPMFIPGNRVYFPYVAGGTSVHNEKIPNLKDLYTPQQRIGMEDVWAAEKSIKKEIARLSKARNKTQLLDFKQKNPLKIEDVFVSAGVNDFNGEVLTEQAWKIESESAPRYKKYRLEWERDTNTNEILEPRSVIANPAKETDVSEECVLIYKHPKRGYKDLDIGGVDGYNEDNSDYTRSLGCTVVVRRGDVVANNDDDIEPARYPVCLYYKRPRRKELFWEVTAKISVYYGLRGNTMISAESDAIIKYYKDIGLRKYLSPRPRSFDAPETKMTHDYGTKMTAYSKPRMLGLLQSWVEDYTDYCWFLEMIQDLIAYDRENVGTDWDSADALGLALMRIEDMRRLPRLLDADEDNSRYELPSFDRNGNRIGDSRSKKTPDIFDILSQNNRNY